MNSANQTNDQFSGKRVKWPLKVWFFLHCTIILLWCLPRPAPSLAPYGRWATPADVLEKLPAPAGMQHLYIFVDKYVRDTPLRHYLIFPGFWQYWDMFAPNPSDHDYWIEAELEYENAPSRPYEYPRMATMSIVKKYFNERYRKFSERFKSDPAIMVFVCRDIAREVYRNDKVWPKVVLLRISERTIRAPGVKQETAYTLRDIYRYVVIPEEIQL